MDLINFSVTIATEMICWLCQTVSNCSQGVFILVFENKRMITFKLIWFGVRAIAWFGQTKYSWRHDDAMSSQFLPWLYFFSIRIEWPNASATKLIDQPFRQCAEARVLPSKSSIKCYNLKDLDIESSAASWECIKGEVYNCLVQAAKQLLATWTRSEICTFIEIDKLSRFVTNKD